MGRLISQGTRLAVQQGLTQVATITAATAAAPCVLTVDDAASLAWQDIVVPRGTGFAALDDRPFHVLAADPDNSTVTLENSDARAESGTIAAGATLDRATMLDFCRATFTYDSGERATINRTSIRDTAPRIRAGSPVADAWSVSGFWDWSDQGAALLRQYRLSGALFILQTIFNDGSGLTWVGTCTKENLSASIDAAVTNNVNGAVDGAANFFTSPSVKVELRQFLGQTNVFVNGEPWSFYQGGFPGVGFTSAQWVGDRVKVHGPNPEWPQGYLIRRKWPVFRRLIILPFNGQSNGAGANNNFANVVDQIAALNLLSPLAILQCFKGGIAPGQGGVEGSAVDELIDPAQYQAPLVPAHENINTGRTAGAEVNRDMWSYLFALVIALAAQDGGNVVLPINVSHGGTTFEQCVRHAVTIDAMSWLAGVLTIHFTGPTRLANGHWLRLKNTGAADGSYTVLDTSDGITVTVARATDPGPYSGSAGYALVASAPMVNLRTMVTYAAQVIAPALGLTPYLPVFPYNGNEANDDTASVAAFLQEMFPDFRALVDELAGICGQAEPAWISWMQVGFPVAGWQNNNNAMFGCASNIALGALAASLVPANHCLCLPQYPSKAGGAGDANAVACIHWAGNGGHPNNGARAAYQFLDAVTGAAPTTPLMIMEGEDLSVRVANSTTITATLNRPATVDEAAYISDPGNRGYQAFAGMVAGQIGELLGGQGHEVALDSVAVDGATVTAELAALPADAWGNYFSAGYMNANTYKVPNNTRIDNATYDGVGGTMTYHTVAPHGIGVNAVTTIADMDPPGAAIVPGVATLAGTAGQSIVMPMAADPGLTPITGGSWAAGVATLLTSVYRGRTAGNWITASGNTPAGYNGTFKIIANTPDFLGITVAMASDPGGPITAGGGFIGAGSLAINGEYGLGRVAGLRTQVREPVIDWYLPTTGEPLHRFEAMQLARLDTYASTGHIVDALVELGLDSFFDLVIDMGDPACYPGSGDLITNRGTVAMTFNLGLGPGSDTRDPQFNGTAGNFSRAECLHAQANGKTITAPSTFAMLAGAHNAGGQYTLIAGLRLAQAVTANQYQWANCLGEGSGAAQGTFLRIGTTMRFTTGVRGAANANVFSSTANTAFAVGDFAVVGCGIKDRDNASWLYGNNEPLKFIGLTPVYTGASSLSPSLAPTFWRNGNTGTIFIQQGVELQFLLGASAKLLRERARPLFRTLDRRQRLNIT